MPPHLFLYLVRRVTFVKYKSDHVTLTLKIIQWLFLMHMLSTLYCDPDPCVASPLSGLPHTTDLYFDSTCLFPLPQTRWFFTYQNICTYFFLFQSFPNSLFGCPPSLSFRPKLTTSSESSSLHTFAGHCPHLWSLLSSMTAMWSFIQLIMLSHSIFLIPDCLNSNRLWTLCKLQLHLLCLCMSVFAWNTVNFYYIF